MLNKIKQMIMPKPEPFYIGQIKVSSATFSQEFQKYLDFNLYHADAYKAKHVYDIAAFDVLWHQVRTLRANPNKTKPTLLILFAKEMKKRNITIDFGVVLDKLVEVNLSGFLDKRGKFETIFDSVFTVLQKNMGVDINASLNKSGKNLLMLALIDDAHVDVVEKLIQIGFDPDYNANGVRPAHCIAMPSMDYAQKILLLIGYGARLEREEQFQVPDQVLITQVLSKDYFNNLKGYLDAVTHHFRRIDPEHVDYSPSADSAVDFKVGNHKNANMVMDMSLYLPPIKDALALVDSCVKSGMAVESSAQHVSTARKVISL